MKKFVVIGLGNISKRHRKNLKILVPDSHVFAMSASGRKASPDDLDCDGFVTSIDEVIALKPVCVIIASPSTKHLEHAQRLIKNSIPVLIEKPIAANANDARQLLHLLQSYPTPAKVGYCLRYLTSAKVLKSLIDEEKVGKIYNVIVEVGQYLPDWRPVEDYRKSVSANEKLGGGALLELSHELDYCSWLFGQVAYEYAALGSSNELGLAVEDIVTLIGRNQSGTKINIYLDFIQKSARRHCRVVGSKGVLNWDLKNNEIEFIDASTTKILYSEPSLDRNHMYLDMMRDFFYDIEHNRCSYDDIASSVELIESIELVKQKTPILKW